MHFVLSFRILVAHVYFLLPKCMYVLTLTSN